MSQPLSIVWPGKSGRTYTYRIYVRGTSFKTKNIGDQIPGNYIYAKETSSNKWSPVYIGQTGDLNQRQKTHNKKDCLDANGATHVHVHSNYDGEPARRAEEEDLIALWQPTCNKLGVLEASQASTSLLKRPSRQ